MVGGCPNCGRHDTYTRDWKDGGERVTDDEAAKCNNCGHAFNPDDAVDDPHDAWHSHREQVLKDAGLWDEYQEKEPTIPPDTEETHA